MSFGGRLAQIRAIQAWTSERRAWSSAEEFDGGHAPIQAPSRNALPLLARVFARGEGGGRGVSSLQASDLLHLTVFKINRNGGKTLQRQKPFGCGNFSVVGPLKGQPGKFGHKSLFCQSYRCKRCRNPKLKKVRARIAQIATEHKLTRMATLTLDPKRIPKGKQTDRYLRECWNEMRVSLARKFGKSIPYVGVLEFHKSGIAHLHLLVGQYISQRWLSDAWYGIGGGRIVDIRYVDVHRVSAYLSVYLAGDKVQKTLELLPKRARIFTTARSIVLWGRKKKSGWSLRRMSLSELVHHAEHVSNMRFTPVDDLKAFGLEIFSYFESPPFAVATGGREAFDVIRESWPIWAQKVSHGKPGEVVKLKPKGAETL